VFAEEAEPGLAQPETSRSGNALFLPESIKRTEVQQHRQPEQTEPNDTSVGENSP